jgi:predicted DNA-binding transcriptional regulator YafY
MTNIYNVIASSAKDLVLVKIGYKDSKGNLSERATEPYEIKNGKYYGFCLNKGSIRAFDLDGITYATKTREKFSPRWPVKIL